MRSWSTNRARQLLDVAVSRFRPHSQGTRDRRQALDSLGAGNSHDHRHPLGSHPVMPERGEAMSGHVYGLSEIVGTSKEGLDDAIRVGVQRAARTVRGLDWFEVTDIRGHLADGEIEYFQVTLKIGFRMEDPKEV